MNKQAFTTYETAWCPGCGNFAIIETLTGVLNQMETLPHQVVLVGGIGQAAKTNQYITANGFSGLHGRALPAAVAIKIVNDDLTVIVNTGDGDSYGEGGNHFLHNIRRNVDITHFVHDNQIYGLTKGQPSPTSDPCDLAHKTSACNLGATFNPLLIAIAAGATFVARSFSGDKKHLAQIMEAAIRHPGYALVDILQPCVSFNKKNTFAYYKQRVKPLDDTYDATNKLAAIEKAMEFGDTIPIGILYQEQAPSYAAKRPELFDAVPIVNKQVNLGEVQTLINSYI
ncbi:2-oxoacid:ferredoxin oxidoreductase subunit beta [Acetobacterium sp. KB-1]|jgi:2-oxoglutarate ferredoxin oxidoreductase subunit beta|uniref:2-oxoacid:ferredoxin oxidoreductase subunit beta n=1 Tax=Acetobacterium sp. KB-1 TaxID=2184575 RepID=UPI000DBEBAEE|nr:2-oxoacid:ferredoxin oxidoreductase subunit beta [Acetobacterium sp. KB-1]AWW27684.1 2-oxoacid ferredoxin oxidoreductase [Acetobacterium sp. KB-1]